MNGATPVPPDGLAADEERAACLYILHVASYWASAAN
jgi:hypothetical protein